MSTLGNRQKGWIVSQVETITPKRAAEYLATMVKNRPVRRNKVEQYARDMGAGRWHLNGEPVIFAADGGLIDGQHRMRAVMAAGVNVDMLVVRGVEAEGFVTIDTGANRDFGDVLAIGGDGNAKLAASLTRLWHLYEMDAITGRVVPTASERQTTYEAHTESIHKGVSLAWKFKQARRLLGAGVVGFVGAYLSEKYDEETAFLFLESVDRGDGLREGDPVWALRRLLVNNLTSSRRLKQDVLLALCIKSFNQWVRGRKVKLLVWRPDEQYPRFAK